MLDRPTEVVVAVGTTIEAKTTFSYNDIARIITTASDLSSLGDGLLVSHLVYDGLGRTIETRKQTPAGMIKTTQSYDGMSRLSIVSNPHISTSEDTYSTMVTTFDGLSRATKVENFDRTGASTGAVTTLYLGNQTTVTDQQSKKRRSVTDALGRLVRVDEPDANGSLDNQPTSYEYDVLDNLTKVTQGS